VEECLPQHNITSYCNQTCGSITDPVIDPSEADALVAGVFGNSNFHLLQILGFALFCGLNNYIYVINCPYDINLLLNNLLSSTLGNLYRLGDNQFLNKRKMDDRDMELYKDNRIVVFNDAEVISDVVLSNYFDREKQRMCGGKKYYLNTSFIVMGDKFPVINPRYSDMIYYHTVDKVDRSEINNINELYEPFMSTLLYASHICSNYQHKITLPLLPLPFTNASPLHYSLRSPNAVAPSSPSSSKSCTKGKPVQKSARQKEYEKEIFYDFIKERTYKFPGERQLASKFRENVKLYIKDRGLSNKVDLSEVSIGRYLSPIIGRMDYGGNGQVKPKQELGRMYYGICSVSHNIAD